MKKFIAAAVALSLLLLGGLWRTEGSSNTMSVRATASPVTTVDTSIEVEDLVPVEPASQRADAFVSAATELAGEPDVIEADEVGSGSVLVRVISCDTELPVRGVAVSLEEVGLPDTSPSTWFDSQTGTTDQDGKVLFSGIRFDGAEVIAWRTGPNGQTGVRGHADVREGETEEVTIRIGGGRTIRGQAVDELDRGIAGAEIWLSQGNGLPIETLLVGRADQRGRFEIRHAMGFQAVGARAPGWEPSVQETPLIEFNRPRGSEGGVKLVLKELGGSIRGRVVTPSSEPVVGAFVRIESAGAPLAGYPIDCDDGTAYAPAALILRTDTNGAFHTSTVGSGSFTVTARGRETDAATSEVLIAPGGAAEVELVLSPSGSLTGVVTDHLGQPIAGAQVATSGVTWGPSYAATTTDETGAYALPVLQTGPMEFEVVVGTDERGVNETVHIRAGTESTWSPSIPAPLVIVGQALSTSGEALEGFHVLGIAEGTTGAMAQFEVDVEADGRFLAPNCLDASYDLSLHSPGQRMFDPLMGLEGVKPGGVGAEFAVEDSRLPRGGMTGTVMDSNGNPLAFHLELEGQGSLDRDFDQQIGFFEISYLRPGPYRLTFSADGFTPSTFSLASPLAESEMREIPEIRLVRQP